jgi:hypothetical protein
MNKFVNRLVPVTCCLVAVFAVLPASSATVGISAVGDPSEGGSSGGFWLTASGLNSGETIEVSLGSTGQAHHPFDYTTSPWLDFPITVGAVGSRFVSILAVDDTQFEGTESFTIQISSARGRRPNGEVFFPSIVPWIASFYVYDNDKPPVSISAIANAKESPQTKGKVRISRPGVATGSPLTVYYALSGSATGPSPSMDYTIGVGSSTSVTIPAGATDVDVEVIPWHDGYADSNDTVVFTLSPNSAYTIPAPGAATVIIND